MSTTSAITPAYPAEKTAKSAHARGSFVSHARLIGGLTLVSRILGMARETVMSDYFGAGPISSAFTFAFKVPNLFRKLLGEGALSAAFIPLYAQAIKDGDAAAIEEANRFAAASVSLLGTILVGLTIFGELGLWVLTRLVNLRPENLLVVKFTAIMLPYVVLVCGTAFLSGILQVHRRFALPALTPVVLNLIHIGVIVLGASILSLRATQGAAKIEIQTRLAYWLAAGVLAAGVVQVQMLLPSLRAVGFRLCWVGDFWTPQVRRMLKLSVPVALSAGVLQASVVIDSLITAFLTRDPDAAQRIHLFGSVLAYPLEPGALARLNWAQLLYQFPLGVFAIALATAIFPTLSTDALDRDSGKFRSAIRHGVIVTLMEGLAASVGLIIVRYPAIRLLYQHGEFKAADTAWVALSTCFFAAAIWAFSLQQILNRAYYAMHDTMTPMVMAIVTIVVNTAVEVPLAFTGLKEAGIAAGTLASFALQAIVMLIMLDKRIGGLGLTDIARSILKTAHRLQRDGRRVLAGRKDSGLSRGDRANAQPGAIGDSRLRRRNGLSGDVSATEAGHADEGYSISLTIPASAAAAIIMPRTMVMKSTRASRGMRRTAPHLIVL
jgi:putative peptidoglycan lipid II flippase